MEAFLHEGIYCTANFAVSSISSGTELLGERSKPAMNFLFVQDGKEGAWNVLLCSVEDAQELYKILMRRGTELPVDRMMILARSNFTPLLTARPGRSVRTKCSPKWKLAWQEDAGVKRLMLGILLTQRHLRGYLSQKKNMKVLENYIESALLDPETLKTFYENRVVQDLTDPSYIYGGLKEMLDFQILKSAPS